MPLKHKYIVNLFLIKIAFLWIQIVSILTGPSRLFLYAI